MFNISVQNFNNSWFLKNEYSSYICPTNWDWDIILNQSDNKDSRHAMQMNIWNLPSLPKLIRFAFIARIDFIYFSNAEKLFASIRWVFVEELLLKYSVSSSFATFSKQKRAFYTIGDSNWN